MTLPNRPMLSFTRVISVHGDNGDDDDDDDDDDNCERVVRV